MNSGKGAQGVLTRHETDRTDLPDGTIISAVPAELVFVRYVDKGRIVQGLAWVTPDGQCLADPDGQDYTAKLRSFSEKARLGIASFLERFRSTSEIPVKDPVDAAAEHFAGGE